MVFSLSKITSALKLGLKNDSPHPIIVGIDLGSTSIKAVQIHVENGIARLDTYGEILLGPYAGMELGKRTNLDRTKLTEAVVDLLREASVTTKNVALPIPYASSFSTAMTIATKDENQIASMMPIEAKKYVPMARSEVSLDWYSVSTQLDPNGTQLMLVAIYNTAIQKFQGTIAQSGLESKYTELEMFSAVRSCLEREDTHVGVIDIGATAARLYITTNGVIERTHGVQMGGELLTNTIAKQLNISFAEAEEHKIAYGLTGEADSSIKRAMSDLLERGFMEFYRVLVRHRDEIGTDVKKIVLMGGGSMLKGIDSFAEDRMQQKVMLTNPFKKLAYPAFLEDTLTTAGSTFSIAIGAALRVLTED